MSQSTRSKPPNDRPTIGFLTHEIWGTFGSLFWNGMLDAIEREEANLICFPGGNLRPGQRAQANAVYDLASAQNVDGLVISGSSLSSFVGPEYFGAFCERYRPLPMVNLAATVDGIPAVLVDNYQGTRDVLTHLVDVHGCRRMAFIPGPSGNAEAQERYQAYTDALNDRGIPLDPHLVAPAGDWNPSTGRRAIRVLLDQRGVDFDAVVAANDRIAAGALEELQTRGMIVPDDAIVTGFDDSEEAWFLTPPLTTVRQPMLEHFRQATKMILARIRGERVPEQVTIPTSLVVRQSCGCLDPRAVQLSPSPVKAMGGAFREAVAGKRSEIVEEMSRAVANRAAHLPTGWARQLLDEFTVAIEENSAAGFLLTLDQALRQTTAIASNASAWHGAVAVLRRHALPYLDHEKAVWAEYLCQKARVMIEETARRTDMRQAWQKMEQARLLGNVEADLITAFDVATLMDVLAERLPTLGIPGCYLSLYEDPARPGDWARLILAYEGQQQVALAADGLRFPSLHLIPDRFWPRERRYHFVVEPLYFHDRQLGFVVFEAGSRDGDVYEMLRRGLSSALQGALLVEHVRERSAELMRQQYILDTFMESVPDRIYFKDLESRITRANKAHATMMGFGDPAEEIGKTDFDLFPQELAQAKYDLEQEIIQTGRPVLTLEEADGPDVWMLTTKMPLRDEHGEIVGTFGISRDITALKQAQAALAQAYTRVEQQVAERTAELQQEISERKRAEEELRGYRDHLEELVEERTRELKKAQAELMRQERLSALGQLTATVAHEIRNPLGTVRTAVFSIGDAIERDQANRVERALQLAERNIVRCDDIITELLDYTRDQTLQKTPTRIDAWLDRILDEAREQCAIPESIALIRELHAGADVPIDAERLRRAVVNVLNNAVDAMREKGPFEERNRLTVRTKVVDDRLEVQISDTGCGIPEDVRGRLFEPLFSTKSFGVGLGLSVVRSIMEHHDGGIQVSSRAGEGTTITLWLPLSDNEGD